MKNAEKRTNEDELTESCCVASCREGHAARPEMSAARDSRRIVFFGKSERFVPFFVGVL